MLLKCCWSNKKNSFNWEKAQHNYTVWPASVGQRCPQVTSSIAFFTPSVPTVMPVYKDIFCTVNDTNWVETDIIWLHWAKKKRCVCGIFLLIWALMAFFVVVFGEEPWDDDTRWGCTQCYWSEPLATCLLTLGFEVREWQLLFPHVLMPCWFAAEDKEKSMEISEVIPKYPVGVDWWTRTARLRYWKASLVRT